LLEWDHRDQHADPEYLEQQARDGGAEHADQDARNSAPEPHPVDPAQQP
jgi:hypothetical protein